jgi:hypothetical protein
VELLLNECSATMALVVGCVRRRCAEKTELIRRRLVQNSAAVPKILGWLGFAPFPAAAAKFDGCGLYFEQMPHFFSVLLPMLRR